MSGCVWFRSCMISTLENNSLVIVGFSVCVTYGYKVTMSLTMDHSRLLSVYAAAPETAVRVATLSFTPSLALGYRTEIDQICFE